MFSRRWSKTLRLDAKRLQFETLEDRRVMSASAVTGSPLPVVEQPAVQTATTLLTTQEWVQSLTFTQFNQLLPEHIQYLTTAQIATIPNTSYFSIISAPSRAMFNAPQVQALNVANIRINLLTPPQIGFLTTAQVRSLPFFDFEFLGATQIPLLTSGQIASINGTAVFDTWTPASKAALTVPQIQSLNMSLVRPTALSATQIGWLTVPQIQLIANYDLNLLASSQIPSVSTAQIASIPTSGFFAAWSPAARAALTTAQVQAINPAALSLPQLTAAQIGVLTTAQIQGLPSWDLWQLSPAQVPLLTSAQIASINTEGALNAWSSAARAALTITQVRSLNMSIVRPTALNATQIGWLTTPQIQSIANYDFNLLSPIQIPLLTAAQIASIPNPGSFGTWSASARAALTNTQIQAINNAALSLPLLTAAQIGALLPAQIQSVPYWDMWQLSPAQVPLLTSAQIASINTEGALNAWSPAARAALTITQVRSLNMSVIRPIELTAIQIDWLTVAQIQTIANYDFNVLTQFQIPYLTTAQIGSITTPGIFAAWSATARAALTNVQVQSIRTSALSLPLLTTAQIGALLPVQVQSVPFWDLSLLPPSQIPQVTSAQLAAVTSLSAWTAESRAALTGVQVQSLNVALVRITLLTSAQRLSLTLSQIRSLVYYDFLYLSPSQISFLTPSQIAGISMPGVFTSWTPQARAAMTAVQIPAISSAALSLSQWTPAQIGWLSLSQIQLIPVFELHLLNASQIPSLTTTQIVGINARAYLAAWTSAARAALTSAQVQALDVANAGIALLTPTQVGWLTYAQIQNVANYEYGSLIPWQIPLLAPELFASIPAGGFLANLSDASQAMLTRAQLLNLPEDAWAGYALAARAPADYHPAEHLPIGADGLQVHANTAAEIAKFFALAPVELATHVSVASGDWTNPAVWAGGVVPTAGAKVLVSTGTTVRFNAFMTAAIDTLRIDGKLWFATAQNTQLKVDTILVTTAGILHVGTAADPVRNNVTARILIADAGPINLTRDPHQLGRGLVSRGEVRMHGMAVTPYVTLAVQPVAGATTLYLSSVPTNWRVGDRIVVSGTVPTREDFGADEVTILAISGSQVTTTPLQFSHVPPAGYGLSVHVANLNRNVVLTAEDSSVVAERPHMVFFHNPNVALDNIGVYGFGRTDKSVPVTDPVVVGGVLQPGTGANPRARYAIHFHHAGVNPAYAPATVRGSLVEGSPGWGYVNHSSNVDFSDNVAYKIKGAAFTTEDGNEIGSMVRNLAINSTGVFEGIGDRQGIHDFGFQGHGFWLQGPGINLVDNIAAGSTSGGFSYFTSSTKNKFDAINIDDPELAGGRVAVPVDTVPLKGFTGNTAYAGRAGLEIWHHMFRMTEGQSYVDDFTSWNNNILGIQTNYSSHITVRNSTLIGNLSNPTGYGVLSNTFTADMTFENLHAAGFQVGIGAPLRGYTVVNGGYFAAVHAIYIEKGYDSRRSVDIMGSITFATLNAAQLQGRRQYSVYMSMNVDFADHAANSFDSFFAADQIYFRPTGSPVYKLFYFNQMKGVAPFTAAATGAVPAEYLNLKNWQLQLTYGKVYAGEMVANYNSFEIPSIYGLVRKVI